MQATIKKITPYLKFLLLIIILVFFSFFAKNNLAVFKKLLEINFFTFFLVSLLTLLHFLISSWLFYYLLKIVNIKIIFFNTFKINQVSFLFNLLLIKTGTVMRGVYLKKHYDLSVKNYFILTSVMGVSSLIIATLFIFILSTHVIILKHPEYLSQLLIYTGSVTILFLLIYCFFKKILKKYFIFSKSIKTLAIAILISGILIFIQSFKLYIIYKFVYSPISFSNGVFMSSFGSWTQIISLTPGALGVREGAMAFAATIMGENLAESAAVLSLDRAIEIFWILIVGTCSYLRTQIQYK